MEFKKKQGDSTPVGGQWQIVESWFTGTTHTCWGMVYVNGCGGKYDGTCVRTIVCRWYVCPRALHTQLQPKAA